MNIKEYLPLMIQSIYLVTWYFSGWIYRVVSWRLQALLLLFVHPHLFLC